MSFDNTVARTARELRNEKGPYRPSPTLRQRTLEQISAVESPRLSRRILSAPLFGMGAVVMVVAAGSAAVVGGHAIVARLYPPAVAQPQTITLPNGTVDSFKMTLAPAQAEFLAQVQEAMHHANSWHIVGPDSTTNRRVEIWGSIHPFFFRAQDGSEVVVDDGVTRTHILPLAKYNGKTEALTVAQRMLLGGSATLATSERQYGDPDFSVDYLTPLGSLSYGLAKQLQYISPGTRVSLVSNTVVDGKPASTLNYAQDNPFQSSTSGGPDSLHSESTLFVDARTKLPFKYSLEQVFTSTKAGSKKPYPYSGIQTTTVSYNVDIPASLRTIALSPKFEVADMREMTRAVASKEVVAPNITLRPLDVAQDAEGNVRIVCDLYHEGRPYTGRLLGDLTKIFKVLPIAEDEKKRVYIRMNASHITASQHLMLYLTPETPYVPGTPRSAHLTLHVPIWPSFAEQHNSYNSVALPAPTLPAQWLAATVDLPAQSAPLPKPSDWQYPQDRLQNYNPVISAAIARAEYYSGEALYGQFVSAESAGQTVTSVPTRSSSHRDLAAYWWNAAATEADHVGNRGDARQYRFQAAQARKAATPSGH